MSNYDIALVLTQDEFSELLEKYEAWIDSNHEALLAVDEALAQDVGTSLFTCLEDRRKAAEGRSNERICNLDELTFLCGDLTAAGEDRSATFSFAEYLGVRDIYAAAAQLVWNGREPIWRIFASEFVAILLDDKRTSFPIEIFRKYVGRYLPDDFDYSTHVGPLVLSEDPKDEEAFCEINRSLKSEGLPMIETMWWDVETECEDDEF